MSLFFQCFITNKFSSKHQPVMAPGPLTQRFGFCGFVIYFWVLVLYCFFFSVWYYFRALWSIACYLLCPVWPGLISVFSQSCLCVFPFLFWSYVIFSFILIVSYLVRDVQVCFPWFITWILSSCVSQVPPLCPYLDMYFSPQFASFLVM